MITQRPELAGAVWRVSSYSGNSGNCVVVAMLDHGDRAVRDSKHPDGPILTCTAAAWAVFTAGVRSGR